MIFSHLYFISVFWVWITGEFAPFVVAMMKWRGSEFVI